MVHKEEINVLRERIKQQYASYRQRDRDRFPNLDFNTNRANYEPLRQSFEEELFLAKNLDRTTSHLHIPSTDTLAKLFTDDDYIPSKKILNTCHLYVAPASHSPTTASAPAVVGLPQRKTWLLLAGVVTLLIGAYMALSLSAGREQVSQLDIHYPRPGQVVPRATYAEGRVTNYVEGKIPNQVWVVVHPINTEYYIQDVVPIETDGTWKCNIVIGENKAVPSSSTYEIRAFIKPTGTYEAFDRYGTIMFNAWPEAAVLASKPVVVVRAAKVK